jgi:hypothetical protein
VENRYVVYICVCIYIYNGAAIWVAFNCNSYQMHLNIDLDMDTQDDFKYAVSVLQDNLQDYDICRSKLVTRHISSPKKCCNHLSIHVILSNGDLSIADLDPNYLQGALGYAMCQPCA